MTATGEANPTPVLELVIPVYNEAHVLDRSVRRLRAYLDQQVGQSVRLTIADNGSTDGTRLVAERVVAELDGVRLRHVAGKGRGGALRAAWTASDAAVVGYTDVDLSTDPVALGPMITAITSGRCDLAVATRLHADAHITRGFTRDVLSRGYNLLLRAVLGVRFSDAQCGFKLVRADIARELMPSVEDDGWFFDTELLVAAQRRGLRILDVPVTWVDDPDSRVDVLSTVLANLRGVARLRCGSRSGGSRSGGSRSGGSRSGGSRSGGSTSGAGLHAGTSRRRAIRLHRTNASETPVR